MPCALTTTSPRFVCATETSAGTAVALGAKPMFDGHNTAAAAMSTQASMVNGVFIWGPHSRYGCGPPAAPTTTSRSTRYFKERRELADRLIVFTAYVRKSTSR